LMAEGGIPIRLETYVHVLTFCEMNDVVHAVSRKHVTNIRRQAQKRATINISLIIEGRRRIDVTSFLKRN
jgi:hypothetical protein